MSGALKLNPAMSTTQFAALKFSLRQDYVPRDAKWFKMVQGSTKAGNDASYQKMAAAVTYQDYFAFMNASYLQKSTNALHDVFCKKGLDVSSAEGDEDFNVYGDDSMFSSDIHKEVIIKA